MHLISVALNFLLVQTTTALPSLYPRATAATACCTNSDLTHKLSPIAAPVRGTGSSSSAAKTWRLTVDDSTAGYKQTLTGFGAAVTDATVTTLNSLSATNLNALLNTLMTSSGAAFSMMRHTIGSSDLSPAPAATYDDNGGQPDLELANFTLGSQGTAMAKLLASMRVKNPLLTVVGSPWSPPGWMKTNGVLVGSTMGNNLNDRYLDPSQESYVKQFADYFVKYIQAFATQGVRVDAITLQNEPLLSSAAYPTMYMYDWEQGHLIQSWIGPTLAQAGLATSIWAYDHNTDVPSYPQNVLTIAREYTNTVAWHCYAGNLDWTVMSDFHDANPGVEQYMSECWTPAVDSRDWFQAANFTLGPLQNWAVGVMAWGLGSDASNGPFLPGGCPSCRGLVTVNADGSYTLHTAYYLLAHFSKFMPRGAIVLRGTGSSVDQNLPGVQFVATLNPDRTRTVVVLNTFADDVYVTLEMAGGQVWSGNVLAASLVTWVLPAV